MFFTQSHIEAQIEAVQKAGFNMHVHADGDGSVRTVLDAFEAVQKRLGPQGAATRSATSRSATRTTCRASSSSASW